MLRLVEPGDLAACACLRVDGDEDGVGDCNDLCLSDPGKGEPGVCGCGVPDFDADGNGTIDCVEVERFTPPPPRIRLRRVKNRDDIRRLVVTLGEFPGATYRVTVTRQRKKNRGFTRGKTRSFEISRPRFVRKRISNNRQRFIVRYEWLIPNLALGSETSGEAVCRLGKRFRCVRR